MANVLELQLSISPSKLQSLKKVAFVQRASHYTKNKILILCHAMAYMTRLGLSLQLISFHSVSPIKLSSHLRDPIKLISALGLCICSSISHLSHPLPTAS